MSLDSKIIDFWKVLNDENRLYEITPSGKLFVYDINTDEGIITYHRTLGRTVDFKH